MSYMNKCRICLSDGVKYPIFDGVESKESIYSKLFQCFKEKIEDIEGYPRKICETCNNSLETIHSFFSKYKTTCKLLESGLVVVKKEIISQESDVEFLKEEIEIVKNEPDLDDYQTLEDFIDTIPLTHVKQNKSNNSFTELKEKLKTLSEINFKKKPLQQTRRKHKPNSKVASSILEAEFDWNGESVKSKKLKKPKKEKSKPTPREPKLQLPKIPKQASPPPLKLCDICGEVFKDHDKLNHHRARVHFSKPMSCPLCSKVLASDHYLKRHIKRTHEKSKEFICDECGRGYCFKAELTNHVNIVHLKVKQKKKYSCKLCDKTYAAKKSVLIHERSAHTGHRPAECTVCGSTFYHEEYLKEHMRLHTGEAPFKCPICGRGYAQRGNMRSHISHNHRLADLDEETKSTLKPHWFKWLKAP